MSTIDEIINELVAVGTGEIQHIGIGDCPDEVVGYVTRDAECPACTALSRADELRELIAAAIDDARREGAEQMREAAAKGWDGCMHDGPGETLDIGESIRALSLPTGQRQVARLTDEQIGRAIARGVSVEYQTPGTSPAEVAMHGMLMSMGRSIESAVLAANGLEGGAA